MEKFLIDSVFFGAVISLLAYEAGLLLKKKFKLAILNPLLLAVICVMAVLVILDVDYEQYNEGAKYISYLMTPATVCLAVPLYEQLSLLKKNFKAVAAGIISGVLASLVSVLGLSVLFGLNHEQYVTLLPKSITTAIGMGISEELDGIVTITVASIIITGILGNVIAEFVCKVFKIHHPIAKGLALGTASHAIGTAKAMEIGPVEGAMRGNVIAEFVCKVFKIHHPIAKGLALGTASHAIGTAKAMEIGPVEGAMSSLAIAVAGLLTVIGASVFAGML